MFGGQKRAHSPDANDGFRNGMPQPHFARGPHHGGHPFNAHQQHVGGHQQFHKRHRGDYYQHPQSIEDKIARLGETGSRNLDIGVLAKDIDEELMKSGPDGERVTQLTAKICKSIISFPTRIGTYATLIGLISVKRYNVSCQIIQTLHDSYPVYLEAQRWQEALTIIHLLSSLVNCKVIRPSALLSQFEFLLESTLEDNIPQSRSDYFVYTVLSSLPFVALELSQQEDIQANFEKMLSTIETYLSKRSKDHLNCVRVWMSSDSTIQMDYLDSLWVQMKNFRANNWEESFLFRPYNEKEYKDTMASSLIPTNSPTFQIPAHSDKNVYPHPRIVFRIYEDDVVENQKHIPGSDKIERFCIENNIRQIIDETSTDPKGCARHLTHMFSWDQVPLKHLLVETILGEMLTLPKPKHEEILYHVLLYELSKTFHPTRNPDEIKNNYDIVINEAVKVLFENLDSMNVTCFTRVVNWFSFHLNNTSFLYPWKTWAQAVEKEPNSPKPTFVRDILERCIRLSFRKKIEEIVQDNLTGLIPPEVCVKFQPVFADHPRAIELTDTVRKLIGFKADPVEICQKLNIKLDNVELPEDFVLRDEKLAEQLLKIDIFTAVILDMAQKSLTHISSAIGKYKNVLKTLAKVPQGQIQLLQTTHSCLVNHPQLQIILVDKLLKADLLDSEEVVKWIFSEGVKPDHMKSFVWEILNNTILRSRKSIDSLMEQKAKLQQDEKSRIESKTKPVNDGSGTPNADEETDQNGANSADPKSDGDVEMSENAETGDEQKKKLFNDESEKLDLKLDLARDTHKNLILQVFRMFATLLNDHISQRQSMQTSFMDCTYRWLTGRMQEVYYTHFDTTSTMLNHIQRIVDGIPSVEGLIYNLNQ